MAAPTPDPKSLRGAKRAERAAKLPRLVVDLDSGRTFLPQVYGGPVPRCPLPNVSVRELELWETLWRRPQARIWADLGQELEVGIHVRTLAEGERPDAPASLRSLALAQARALLLTPQTLKAAGFVISDGVAPGVQQPAARSVGAFQSSRGRLQAVPKGG